MLPTVKLVMIVISIVNHVYIIVDTYVKDVLEAKVIQELMFF